LLVPKRSTLKSRSEVDLNREFIFKHSKQHYNGTPVVASNMDTVGTFEMARALAQVNCFTTIHKWYTIDDWKNFRDQAKENPKIFDNIAVSSGSSNDDFDKIRQVLEAVPELKYICLDVANGYSETFVDIIRRVREQFANHTIFAGNVVTAEMVEQLILTGADLVKVGIGPGSVCTTRSKAGVGYPQFSAVLECSDAAHGLGGHIISDGGCTCPGDVAKAFGAGADFVMLGGLLAGHDQSGGEIIEKNGKKPSTTGSAGAAGSASGTDSTEKNRPGAAGSTAGASGAAGASDGGASAGASGAASGAAGASFNCQKSLE
uniref:GMP reductase n=1 Tax=Meloidogyne floridensis TaxID=298350 RepID=A0A915NL26_9BILA